MLTLQGCLTALLTGAGASMVKATGFWIGCLDRVLLDGESRLRLDVCLDKLATGEGLLSEWCPRGARERRVLTGDSGGLGLGRMLVIRPGFT